MATIKKINSIISVSVNGITKDEAIVDIQKRLDTVEKSAFNIALLCAYSLGDTIPAHTDSKGNTHGEAICENPYKEQKDLLIDIGKSKSTLSRWLKAYRLIVEKGYFNDFASGLYPFSYDKIIDIFTHEENFAGFKLDVLMNMSASIIEAMAKAKTSKTDEAKTETTEEVEAETTDEVTEEKTEEVARVKVSFVYNDKRYFVDKVAFEKWLEENATDEQLAENAELK